MALAKYYENIRDRLEEDRKSILERLHDSKFRRTRDSNLDLVSHIEAHLRESEKTLDKLLELVTDPEHQTPITSSALHSEQRKTKNLEEELKNARQLSEQSQRISTTMKCERDDYKIRCEKHSFTINSLKRDVKDLKHKLKNAKRSR